MLSIIFTNVITLVAYASVFASKETLVIEEIKINGFKVKLFEENETYHKIRFENIWTGVVEEIDNND